jgi:hypothetical protein
VCDSRELLRDAVAPSRDLPDERNVPPHFINLAQEGGTAI